MAIRVMSSRFEMCDVARVDTLEGIETEGRQHGGEVLHDLGLDGFVARPVLVGGEAVNLNGQAVLGGGQRSHHQHQIAADEGVAAQVECHVGAQQTEVGVDGAR